MLNGQAQALETITAWLLSALVYPGLLFGVGLALVGEWALNAVRPVFTPHIYHARRHARHLIQPLYDFLKLAGRQNTTDPILTGDSLGKSHPLHTSLAFVCALSPVLALTLLPFPDTHA